jgi:TonB family protein
MKTIFLFLSLAFCCSIFGQTNNDPLTIPFKIDKDTLYAMVDHQGIIQNLPGVQYLQKWWPENGKYHVYLYDGEKGNIVKTGWYADTELKKKDGVFEEFHSNGMTRDSGLFVNNKREGLFKGWYEEGELHHVYHYKNNIPVDTGYVLRNDGSLAEITIADQNGNGIFQDYHENGKVRLLGRVVAGERNGNFTFKREDGTKMMNVIYLKDSVIQTQCFEADGITLAKGSCIFEKVPEFPGGAKGWSSFLSQNLRYPDYAIDKNIQGVVRVKFLVYKDGSIDELEILSSPHESLSKEVLRLMKKSPNWEPAVRYNEPVIYRHVQRVTFRLE